MITWNDLYTVLAAMVPLYVAMFLAYGSVRWWKIFSPDQCSGINRFVAIFAVPLLSFHFISTNDPYAMNLKFIAADTLQKIFILAGLTVWVGVSSNATLDWLITIFSLSTLPNTLVMGIPLLIAMYGTYAGSLMVQVVVLQCIIWYTLLLFLFEYRAAKILIMEQFPDNAASIVSFRVDSDVVSLDGGANFLQADAEVGDDGKLHVTVRKSNVSRRSVSRMMMTTTTPRPSNLTGAEIYSMSSSRNPTPRGSNFNHADFFSVMGSRPSNFGQGGGFGGGGELYSVQSSRGSTPRPSNFDENQQRSPTRFAQYPEPNPEISSATSCAGGKNANRFKQKQQLAQTNHDAKELHMFVWSSSASPVSDTGGLHVFDNSDLRPTDQLTATTNHGAKEIRMILPADLPQTKGKQEGNGYGVVDDLSFTGGGGGVGDEEEGTGGVASSTAELNPKAAPVGGEGMGIGLGKQMPAASVMTRLILIMVWRKLIRNPNTYSSLVGVIWALVSFKWNVHMPKIVEKSISILSDAGLGMAMFSLGIFMALQPKLIACGNRVAVFAMGVRFLTGPAVMAAASIIIGLRGTLLRIAIVQAALPQGIVPFVFAKEYNVHPAILSTMVIFGMLIALPITLLYYVILGL